MSLVTGSRLGAYEILSPLGAGGMGEVYQARDTKLGRDVAVKILPDAFVADPDRRARFEREARTLAALNHPNIAQIYGLEDSGPVHGLVMELVAEPTLADLLDARGPLDPDEAVAIARQIIEALEAAHEAGIVHRDLKPANIKVRDEGTVKVLDFGLAKASAGAGSGIGPGADPMNSPTLTVQGTAAGLVLGTAAYMAPEQARGRPVDKRADIWAFGVVLFEMLSGRRVFASETVGDTLAAVLRAEVDWSALPPSTPEAVRRLLARCLERDPRLRLRDIGEGRVLLNAPATPEARPAVRQPTRRRVWLVGVAGVVLVLVAAATAWRLKPAAPTPVRVLEMASETVAGSFALAPDGSAVAYLSGGHLYGRAFAGIEPGDLGAVPMTADKVFWSPDSQSVAYAAEGTLRRMPAAGGEPFVICTIPATKRIMSASWQADGSITFAVWRDSLYQVLATGGEPSLRLRMDPATEVDFHEVAPLPGGRLIVATHRRKEDANRLEILDGTTRTVLTNDAAVRALRHTSSGWLLFLREGANRGLWALPFAAGPLDFGNAVLVQPGAVAYTVANDGTVLLKLEAEVLSSLVWIDRSGNASEVAGPPAAIAHLGVALSPDQRRVALVTGTRTLSNIVVRDIRTGVDTPLTFRRASESWAFIASVGWFPAGDHIVYVSGRIAGASVFEQRLDAPGSPRELTPGWKVRVAPDGRTLLVLVDERGRGRLRRVVIQADGTAGVPGPVLEGEDDVQDVDISPDGRMLAVSVRSPEAPSNIFLARAAGGAARWMVTTEGGTRPRFTPDGRELVFASGTRDATGRPTGRLMRVPLTLEPEVQVGVPVPLFGEDSPAGRLRIADYDISNDGRRFLVPREQPAAGARNRALLVENWPAMIRSR